MNLTSLTFFLFLLVALGVYYLAGKKLQKYVLLAASLFFYFQAVSVGRIKVILILTCAVGVTWLGALFIAHCKGKARTVVTFLAISALVAVLFVLKYAYNLVAMLGSLLTIGGDFQWLQYVSIMGISYFMLSAIGYLMDVYWESYQPEKNVLTIALFLLWFPQVISGPITRFPMMQEQFASRHKLEYDNVAYGMRRMAWGYFKKLIISERFALIVATVFEKPEAYSGLWLLFATICYVIRLYTDFSGCMDIVLGASTLFGIRLPENFNGPFLSRSYKEFWQRWHITLGGWFKDYVMYPVQISKPMVSLGKKCKKRLGKNIGKKVPIYLSMLVLWFLLGIWHGATAHYFVATGLVPWLLLVGGDWFSPFFDKVIKKIKINPEAFWYRQFQRVRTILVICIGWVFICTEDVAEGLLVGRRMITHFLVGSGNAGTVFAGLTGVDITLMLLGILLLFLEHFCASRETTITAMLDKQHGIVRGIVIYAEVLLIWFFGMVGTSSFIYFNF